MQMQTQDVKNANGPKTHGQGSQKKKKIKWYAGS